MKAMLFAAGLGTRLKPFTNNSPKALAEVNGKSLLEHNVRYLAHHGIKDIVINIHHFPEQVEEAVAKNNGYGSNISFSDERDALLETGGGLLKAAPFFKDEPAFVVMNVDILTNLELSKMITHHQKHNGIATLAVMKRSSSRELIFNHEMNLCGWQNLATGERKVARESQTTDGFAFSGIQVLTNKVIDLCPFAGKFSLIDLYLHLAKTNDIKGYDHTGDILIDVGKPGSVEEAEKLFARR
ncbi:MAG: nucleotidyltransferase family protein [Taibaiella sp.]|nr:nucleotidyltransferase family protein [Taibaiella sp.]